MRNMSDNVEPIIFQANLAKLPTHQTLFTLRHSDTFKRGLPIRREDLFSQTHRRANPLTG